MKNFKHNIMSKENSWLFSQEELNHPPSIEYMTLSKEREWRRLANRFVLNVAKAPRLKLSRATITTAQIFIHRYYMRRTFKDNPWDVSIGAILLASKIEYEYTSRISRYLIHECARTAKKISNPHFELNRKEKEYGYWKNNMLYYETEILRILYYDLNIDEPYSYTIKWCKKYNVSIEEESVINYLLNESYIRTVLCLQYPSKTIAAGAFVLGTFDNKNINWNIWIKDLNLFSEDIKDVSIKLKEMLTLINEKSPSHRPHKYLPHKSLSLQDFVKSPSPLKVSTMNNDIDKNSTDNKNTINNSNILSSPPKSDNSDNHEKDNEKLSKLTESNNEIHSETKPSLNENEDWEVVDMDIDDDDDIPNPSVNINSNIKSLIIQNKESNTKKDDINHINTSNNYENNNIKYDKFKIKNNYQYYPNSRKYYLPPPPPYHFSRSRLRGGNNYSYHYSHSRYSNNHSNSGQSYYNRNSNSSFYRSNSNRNNNNINHKLNNSTNNNNNNNNNNMNTLSPKYNIDISKNVNKSRNPNYYPQY